MRIIGFSKKWDKLNNELLFTTFRYPRRDRDWEVEEVVQVVYKPRSKDREPLGIARIIRKQEKDMANKYWEYRSRRDVLADSKCIHPGEALADGFISQHGAGDVKAMLEFLREPRRGDIINKITLYWIERTK